MSVIEQYLHANAAWNDAKFEFEQLVHLIQEVGRELATRPERTRFSNVGAEGGLPMEMAFATDARSFDGDLWPTATQINARIVARAKARRAAQNAWQAVPPELRSGLVAPQL